MVPSLVRQHTYKTALFLFMDCTVYVTYQCKVVMGETEKLQYRLTKLGLELNYYRWNAPLLHALRIARVLDSICLQELKLFKNIFLAKSSPSDLYAYLFSQHLNVISLSPRCLFDRVVQTSEIMQLVEHAT